MLGRDGRTSPWLDELADSRKGVAIWGTAAALVLAQGILQQMMAGDEVTAGFLLRWRLFPIALWGAAAPAVLAAARRWPLPTARWPVHGAFHAVLFGAWMITSNALLRLPDVSDSGLAGVGEDAVLAAVAHAPPAALIWLLLLVAGARTGTRRGANGTGGSSRVSREKPLSLRSGYRTHLVPREAVRWVEADGDYVRVHTPDGVLRVRTTMKALQRRLGDARFVRIHRSALVSVGFVREVQSYFHGDHVAILRDGTELRVPRSRREARRRLLDPDG